MGLCPEIGRNSVWGISTAWQQLGAMGSADLDGVSRRSWRPSFVVRCAHAQFVANRDCVFSLATTILGIFSSTLQVELPNPADRSC